MTVALPLMGISLLLLATMLVIAPSDGSMPSPGWALYQFEGMGEASFTTTVDSVSGGAVLAVNLFTAEGFAAGSHTAHISDGNTFVSADLGQEHGAFEIELPTDQPGSPTEVRILVGGEEFAGLVLFWSAGDVGEMSWSSDLTGSMTLLATGDRSFYSEGEGFESDVHLMVKHANAGVAIQNRGVLPFHVDSHFIGMAGTGGNGDGEWTTKVSNASMTRECPCLFNAFFGPAALSTGGARVEREGIRVDTLVTPVVLAGVDVPWPTP